MSEEDYLQMRGAFWGAAMWYHRAPNGPWAAKYFLDGATLLQQHALEKARADETP